MSLMWLRKGDGWQIVSSSGRTIVEIPRDLIDQDQYRVRLAYAGEVSKAMPIVDAMKMGMRKAIER